jgi:hypothetical protein
MHARRRRCHTPPLRFNTLPPALLAALSEPEASPGRVTEMHRKEGEGRRGKGGRGKGGFKVFDRRSGIGHLCGMLAIFARELLD